MKPKTIRPLLLLTLSLLAARPALAWDAFGHKVISLIAWEHMRPETRAKAVALLKAAPPDADLASLLPNDGRPLAERERELFLLASTWPDIVRDEAFAERKKKYHHSDWHYVNHYWELDEKGQPRATGRPPEEVNIVERLRAFERSVADPGRDTSLRAIDLAWILHLEGDLHQPLHASSRVTATEPEGDRGGGLFKLKGDDLHWYWDQLVSKVFRKRKSESDAERVQRVARVIQERHPRSSFKDLEGGQYEAWARKGFETSKSFVYQNVERGRTPSREYRKSAFEEVVAPAVALAGYRLAEMLDRVLGGAPA